MTRAGRPPSIPSSLSPSNRLTMGWGRGKPQLLKKQKQKSSLNLNLIHNLQAIQPVILVPLDHFLFFLFFPLPHLCLSSSTCFWWFFLSFFFFCSVLFFVFIFLVYFVLFLFPPLLPSRLILTSLDLVWFLTDKPESSLGASSLMVVVC